MSSESFDMMYMFGAQDESISSISRFSFSADMAMAKPKQCGATTKKGVRCQNQAREVNSAVTNPIDAPPNTAARTSSIVM